MAHLDHFDIETDLREARMPLQPIERIRHAQLMVMAAGLAALGIVAVAAAMMATVL